MCVDDLGLGGFVFLCVREGLRSTICLKNNIIALLPLSHDVNLFSTPVNRSTNSRVLNDSVESCLKPM